MRAEGSRVGRATVLCADVVGSTGLGHALDPEEVQEIVRAAVGQVKHLVELHGGAVHEVAGDGVLALFDHDEEGPEGAVAAGAAIAAFAADRASALGEERGLHEFGIRVGVHQGQVVHTPSGGFELVGGRAIDAATALESAADASTLLVSDATAARLRTTRAWSDRRPVAVPGQGTLTGLLLVPVPQRDVAPHVWTPSATPRATGPREERKVVTVVFVRAVRDGAPGQVQAASAVRAFDHVAGSVERYGGTVKDRAGGSVVAMFGVPRAREDDAERAVRAALDIVEEPATPGVRLCAAVTTGLVVLGPPTQENDAGYSADGDALNTAARLHALARPGSVLVDDETHRLVTDRFTWSPPAEVMLKGKPRPVTTHRAMSASTRVTETRRDGPIVGRGSELRLLAEVAAKQRGVVLLEAEAGVGKSRLLTEFHHRQVGTAVWLEARCSSLGSEGPYGPLRQLVEAISKARSRDVASSSTFLGLVTGRQMTARERRVLTARDPGSTRHEIARELATEVAGIEGPAVIAVEDVHWAPETSIAVLVSLIGLLDEHPVILAMTRRPDASHASQALAQEAADTGVHLQLEHLDRRDQHQLLADIAGLDVLPQPVEERILQAAAGNPLFVLEFIRSLRDQGQLTRSGRGWRFVGDAEVSVPTTVERILLTRIDGLQRLPRALLDVAAVVGAVFTPDVLVETIDHEELDAGGLATALGVLVEADFVETAPDRDAYRFRHAVVQETAYRRLLRRHRRNLHRRVATVLAARDAEAGLVAHHWWRGGDADATFDWAMSAGRRALALPDPTGAVSHLSLALEASKGLQLEPAQELRLLSDLGESARMAGQLTEAVGWIEEAAEIARRLGDVPTLARLAIAHEDATYASRRPRRADGDPAEQLLEEALAALPAGHELGTVLRARLSRALVFSGRAHQGRRLADDAVAEARRSGSASALAEALIAWRMGRQGPDWAEHRLAVIDETVHAADAADEAEVALEAARLRVVDHLELGNVDAADEAIDDATRRIEQLQQPQYQWYPPMWRAMRMLMVGALGQAEDSIALCHEVARRHLFTRATLVHGFMLFLLRWEQGRLDEIHDLSRRFASEHGSRWAPVQAVVEAEAGNAAEAQRILDALTGGPVEETPRDLDQGVRLALTATAASRLGDGRAAEYLYRQLLPFDGRAIVVPSGVACLGSSSHYLGILAQVQGDSDSARRHLQDALASNRRMGATPAVGHSTCALAAATPDRSEAARLLSGVRAVASEHGLIRLEARARHQLEDLEAHPREIDHAVTRTGTNGDPT